MQNEIPRNRSRKVKRVFFFQFITADDLPRCNYGDNVCIPKAINQVLKTIKNGKDEIGLPVFEPLNIRRLDIIQDPSSTIAIKLTFRDVDIYGISFAEVYKTVYDKFKNISIKKIVI